MGASNRSESLEIAATRLLAALSHGSLRKCTRQRAPYVPWLVGGCIAAGFAGAHAADAQVTPELLCTGDPCQITEDVTVPHDSEIDFGERDVVLSAILSLGERGDGRIGSVAIKISVKIGERVNSTMISTDTEMSCEITSLENSSTSPNSCVSLVIRLTILPVLLRS